MAREHQGLQIALIAFVMLTIVFGVTSYIFFRQAETETARARTAVAEAEKSAKAVRSVQELANDLKKYIGVAEGDEKEKINATFIDDMKKHAATLPETSRFYRQALESLTTIVKDRDKKIAEMAASVEKAQKDFADQLAQKEKALAEKAKAFETTIQEFAAARAKFEEVQKKWEEQTAAYPKSLAEKQRDSEAKVTTAEQKLREAEIAKQKVEAMYKDRTEKYNAVVKETLDVVDGYVRAVDQRTGTVYIDLGAADNLRRQTTFNVYAADVGDVKKAAKKASIEVTQVIGDHLSEARVTEDNLSDPIVPGDKINTPVWSPGEKVHFAVAGTIDIDGDGQSDHRLVRNLINMNGGIVDAEVDDKGKRTGEMTLNTRYLVLGDAPEKGTREVLEAYTKIRTEADRLGVEKVSVLELLSRMGWKNQSKVVRYGVGSNPNDFRARSPRGAAAPTPSPVDMRNDGQSRREGQNSAY